MSEVIGAQLELEPIGGGMADWRRHDACVVDERVDRLIPCKQSGGERFNRRQTGEIVVRSTMPWLYAQGYYNMPEANVRTYRNLWFHTGDPGYLDEDGYIYFVDRKKDAIRRRGENISSFEVEQIILKHRAVLEVAAFPMNSEHSEDEVMVSVVLREGQTLSEAELIEHCKENMAYFMVPRFVEFLAALPKTMTEKVEKYKLKADAEKRLAKVWDRDKSGIVVKR